MMMPMPFRTGQCLLIAGIFLISGCAVSARNRVFKDGSEQMIHAPSESVWRAAVAQLQGFPITRLNPGQHYFETSWMEGYTEKPKSIFDPDKRAETDAKRQRIRFFISVEPLDYGMSRLGIKAEAEEGHPLASGGYRWQSVEDTGNLEREFLRRIITSLRTA